MFQQRSDWNVQRAILQASKSNGWDGVPGKIIRINTFDQWGTTFPGSAMLSSSFAAAVAYPRPFGAITPGGTYSEYVLNAIASPPWNPNGNGTYMRVTGSGSPSPNPGVGFYDCVPGMYGALILGGWVRWISGTFFIFRMNDSHSGQTFGTDSAAISIQGSAPSSGQLLFDIDAQTSPATIATNTWYYYEWFHQQGTVSGTPQGAYSFKFYNSAGTLLWTVANTNCTANSNSFNLDSITLDCELGGSTPLVDFGPYVIIDPQTNGIAAMRGPLSFTTIQATVDSSPLQFTGSAAGTHAPLVSVPLPNTAYVQDATVGDADTYSFGSITSTGLATYQTYAQSEVLAVGARNAQAQSSGDFVTTGPTHKAPVNNFGIFLDVLGSKLGTLNLGAGPKVGY